MWPTTPWWALLSCCCLMLWLWSVLYWIKGKSSEIRCCVSMLPPLLSADVCKPCAPGTGIFDSHSCGPVLSWSAEWWLLWVAQVILDTAVSLLSFMQRLLRVTAYSLVVNLSVCVAGCCLLEPGKAIGLQSFPWFTSADKHLCLLCCYWLSTFGIKVSTASPHITV